MPDSEENCDLMDRHDAHFTAWQEAKRRAEAAEAALATARAETAAVIERAKAVIDACDRAKMRLKPGRGIGGQTVEAGIRAIEYCGVDAWPVEELREAVMLTLADATAKLDEIRRQTRAAGMREAGVYVASKAKYGPEWLALRAAGYPVLSTWINESGEGQTSDWPDLWSRCISEASRAAALVLICRPGDTLKGAWAEVGAALANGRRVFAVGIEGFSIRHHPLVTTCESEDAAFAEAAILARATERDRLREEGWG